MTRRSAVPVELVEALGLVLLFVLLFAGWLWLVTP